MRADALRSGLFDHGNDSRLVRVRAMTKSPGIAPQLRLATSRDREELELLIARSVRELGAPDYRPEQIEAALRSVFGIDTQLIADQTYWVATVAGRLVGCGGWSHRRTLFGADAIRGRDTGLLDPAHDAARIRAFFVAPEAARMGIGDALLRCCEAEARAAGFTRFELVATRTGAKMYARRGYHALAPIAHRLEGGSEIEFIPMQKEVGQDDSHA